MSRDTQPNELLEIIKGFFLLFLVHFLVGAGLTVLGTVINVVFGNSSFPTVLMIGALFYCGLSQLLYVIPLTIWLKRRGKIGMMKGVIIAAVLTALLNGGCFLLLFSMSSYH